MRALDPDGVLGEPRERGATVGRYEIERVVGESATGVVYEARDAELKRTVALKVMARTSPELAERFSRDAQAMARLDHHNLVSVFDVGAVGGEAYVAMELVRGRTLRQWMATPHARPEVLGVFLQACAGLAAAHDAGLVHGNFKPEDVLVGDDGVVRVGDVGLASPDMLAGPRADQYCFAAVLYEAVTGAPPSHNSIDPAAVRPRRLARALARGLAPDPDQRFADMRAFGGELHAVLTAPADRFVRLGRASLLGFAALVIVVVRVACC